MTPAGLEAFKARPKPPGKGEYSYENRPDRLPAPYERQFKTHPKAWAFFTAQPPSYRRTAIWWVVSAKQEVTQLKRLATLIKDSANEERIALLRRR